MIGCILFLSAVAAGSTGFVGVKVEGSTEGGSPFSGRGVSVSLNNLFYCSTCSKPWSYQPNGWQELTTLGVNLIRVNGEGTEGDVGHFNMNNYPNEWAQNFDNFLSLANSHGMKVSFAALGDHWGNLFGIVAPDPANGINGTTISAAMAMVDKLAGNNILGHNFITDQRVMGWSVANEVDLGNNVTYNWCIKILDYIRSKGGKAYVSSPYDSRIVSPTLIGQMDFRYIEPELRGHIDYLELHIYDMDAVVQALQKNQDVYGTMYSEFSNIIQTEMIDGHGSIPLSNLIIGEYGIWRGEGSDFGLSYNFSEPVRGAYYAAMLQAAADRGISIIDNHYLFDEDYVGGALLTPAYGVVSTDGKYYTDCTSLLQQFYGVSTVNTTTSQSWTSSTPASLTTTTTLASATSTTTASSTPTSSASTVTSSTTSASTGATISSDASVSIPASTTSTTTTSPTTFFTSTSTASTHSATSSTISTPITTTSISGGTTSVATTSGTTTVTTTASSSTTQTQTKSTTSTFTTSPTTTTSSASSTTIASSTSSTSTQTTSTVPTTISFSNRTTSIPRHGANPRSTTTSQQITSSASSTTIASSTSSTSTQTTSTVPTARKHAFYLLQPQEPSLLEVAMFLLLTAAWLDLRFPRYWTRLLSGIAKLKSLHTISATHLDASL